MPLFGHNLPYSQLHSKLETYIFSFLEITELIKATHVSHSWNKQANEFLKVTLFVWNAGKFRSDDLGFHSALLSEGHAALKTYVGGASNRGIYASFWSGICYDSNSVNNDDLVCRKQTSHFHTEIQDFFAERNADGQPITPKIIHLYHLNIIAMNSEFESLRHANPEWRIALNCSDIVYNLLEIGGAIKRFDPRSTWTKHLSSLLIGDAFRKALYSGVLLSCFSLAPFVQSARYPLKRTVNFIESRIDFFGRTYTDQDNDTFRVIDGLMKILSSYLANYTFRTIENRSLRVKSNNDELSEYLTPFTYPMLTFIIDTLVTNIQRQLGVEKSALNLLGRLEGLITLRNGPMYDYLALVILVVARTASLTAINTAIASTCVLLTTIMRPSKLLAFFHEPSKSHKESTNVHRFFLEHKKPLDENPKEKKSSFCSLI